MDTLKSRGSLDFEVNGAAISLTEEDLLIDMVKKEGFESMADGPVTVVLDIRLTEELINEGFVYEVISKIQTMRKDSGFEVMDHITVTVSENDKIADIIRANEEAISTKVLADEIVFGGSAENAKKWNINGEDVLIGVTRK